MEPQITQGTLQTSTGTPLPLEHTDVSAKINGPVAKVEVKQLFANDTGEPIEAVYLFPLPHEASVHRMSFKIGDRIVNAVVKEKEEARRAYQAALSEGRSATLLEQDRPNLFTLSVANIPAGEKIEVTLGYQEKVAYDEGEWRFVFPMVTADRYHSAELSGGAVIEGAEEVRPPRPATDQRRADISVDVEINPGRPIDPPRSPSHHVVVHQDADDTFRISLHESDSIPNRDLVIAYGEPRTGVRAEVHFERDLDRVGSFMLVVTPPAIPVAEETLTPEIAASGKWRPVLCGNCGGALEDAGAVREVPGIGTAYRCDWCGAIVAAANEKQALRAGMARDVAILVDRSCSMRGSALPQARRAVRMILDHLGENDAVQVFAFDHDRIAADGVGSKYMDISPVTIHRIDELLAGLEARGGTELDEALERVMELPKRERRARIVVLITDAAVGNEGRLLRRIPEIMGDTRLYVLGLGVAVNRYLVARLARAGGGASDVLLPHEDVETVVPRFARRVRQAGPVLEELQLSWDDALPVDVYPNPIPPLFGGQTVQLLGRYNGVGESTLVLTGTTALGEPFRQEIPVKLPEAANMIPGLERLWARQRIDALVERLESDPKQAGEVRMEVLGLALRHSLLSPYTSLVAEDSEKRVDGEAKRVEVRPEAQAEGPPPPAPPRGVAGFIRSDADDDLEEPSASERTLAGTFKGGAMDMDWLASSAPASRAPSPGGPPMGGAPPPPSPAAPIPPPPMAAAMPDAPLRAAKAPAAVVRVSSLPKGERKRGLGAAIGKIFGMGDDTEEEAFAVEDHPSIAEHDRSFESLETPVPDHYPQVSGQPEPRMYYKADDYTSEMLEYVKGKQIGELDLVFLVDETGSMGRYIDQVKSRLQEIIATLERSPLCRSLRLGLVSYRDHPPQDNTFASRVVPLTEDVDAIRKGVNRMRAHGGGDGPESVTDGLYDVARLDWRPRAARVVVLVGDAPPHGVEPSGDGFPEGCPCGHHWYTQAENCREMGVVIHAVGCLPGIQNYVGAEGVFKQVAETTHGFYLPLTETKVLIPLITGVAESDLDRQRIEEHIAEVLARYEAMLRPADQQERIRFVTDVLQQSNVQPRSFTYDQNFPGNSSLTFRDVTIIDVAAGFEQLRRLKRTTL